jgi:Holin of 3TMs, for gene-transfer release
VPDITSLVLSPIFTIIDKLIPDPAAKAAAQLKAVELAQSGDISLNEGQIKVNVVEAASPTIFISGWRPFAGWVCGVGLLYDFLLRPLITWSTAMAGHPTEAPALDIEALMTLLLGMLGLSGMRSYDKAKGVASH